MVEKLTLNVGDSVYVDNNETYNVEFENNIYKLRDLSGELFDTFNSIEHIIPTLNCRYNTVEIIKRNIMINREEYFDCFDDIIYLALQNIGKLKGYNIKALYDDDILINGMLCEIRNLIVNYLIEATDGVINLSPPAREYKVGDTVKVTDDGVCDGVIVWLGGEEKYGLMLKGYEIWYSNGGISSASEYVKYLNDELGVSVE